MERTQPFSTIFKLALYLLLMACGAAEPEGVPTPIDSQAIEATAVPQSTQPINPTPTLQTAPEATAVPLEPGDNDSIGDPYAPELGNLGYDVQLYDIRLTFDLAEETIAGSVTVTAVLTDPLTQLSLDFIGYDISQMTVDGEAANFSREADKLLVDLPPQTAVNETIEIEIAYAGSPMERPSRFVGFAPSLGLYFVDNSSAYILSEPDGTRFWLPNNDHPRDKAAFRFELTVAEGLTAVANGILEETIPNEDGSNTFIWFHEGPMATYLATIAVGNYVRIDGESPNGIPLRHYVFPENLEEFERANAITGEAIDWMSDLFGPYPFENFGFVTAEAPGASLETQTMVILSTRMIGQVTIIHEIAHMWFGNWVSLDSWQEMWRNEGFATYISLMWEHRNDPEGLELEMAAIETAVEENDNLFPLGDPPPERLFSFNTYFGGALMVHDLRQTVGDDAFFNGLRRYFELYADGTASDAQFQAVMEEAYGSSLDAFFAEWLE